MATIYRKDNESIGFHDHAANEIAACEDYIVFQKLAGGTIGVVAFCPPELTRENVGDLIEWLVAWRDRETPGGGK